MPSRPFHLLKHLRAVLRPTGLCGLCALPSTQPLCEPCQAQYLPSNMTRCQRCALELTGGAEVCGICLKTPPPYTQALALGDYAEPVDRLVRRLKFGGEPAIGRWLGRLLAQRWQQDGRTLPDLVVPVPLSKARLQIRGYNQSWEMARGFAGELSLRARSDVLLRVRDAAPQSGLPLEQRTRNIRGAFTVPRALEGARLLLVDDVMTTGSTLTEAASVLLRQGAGEVGVAVALRTPPPH